MAEEGKVAIVTGANCGLGLETARRLGGVGYQVVLACRSEDRAHQALDTLSAENPDAKLSFLKLDLSNFESVREFVKNFNSTHDRLDVLVNNAGLSGLLTDNQPIMVGDAMELTMCTNHLGPFLLTHLLVPVLRRTACKNGEARIVVVASSMHHSQLTSRMFTRNTPDLDLNDLMMQEPGAYNGSRAYMNSKAANIMFAYELARRLEGSGVTVNSLCPGFIPKTELLRHQGTVTRFFLQYIFPYMAVLFLRSYARSLVEGGTSVFRLATDPQFKGVSGKYYENDEEKESSPSTRDESRQRMLWDLSCRLVDVQQTLAD